MPSAPPSATVGGGAARAVRLRTVAEGAAVPAGLVETEVPGNVVAAVERITAALHRRGVPLVATIDHAAGARSVGLALPDEVVLVFGDPAVGTLLMQADPRVGIDLPLRVLVRSDAGTTRVAYRDPQELAGEFAVDGAQETLDRLGRLLAQLAAEAAGTA